MNNERYMRYTLILALAFASAGGCLRMKVDPIEVKPITLNVNLKIDRELDEFFAFEQELGPLPPPEPTSASPATSPATQPVQP